MLCRQLFTGIVFDIVRFTHKAGLKSCMRAAFGWSHDRASCQPGLDFANGSAVVYRLLRAVTALDNCCFLVFIVAFNIKLRSPSTRGVCTLFCFPGF